MSSGPNEPVVFTREDSDRLARIEGKMNDLAKAFTGYQKQHNNDHNKIDEALEDKMSKKGLKWALGILCPIILGGGTALLKLVGLF